MSVSLRLPPGENLLDSRLIKREDVQGRKKRVENNAGWQESVSEGCYHLASGYECKYYRINGIPLPAIYYWKVWDFTKLKLPEISKMVWGVTPFPRSFLTVGKPRTPSPELSDRGQNPASKLTLFYHSCQVIHSNFHIMKISVSSKFLNNQFTVHLHPRNWPYFVEICENRPGLPNNSLQGWSLQPETYKVKFTGKLRGSQIWGEIWENF